LEIATMDDERIWSFEQSLWIGDAEHYRASIDEQSLMVLPAPPYILKGGQAVEAVSNTPRWKTVELTDRQVMRPQEGLIVIAYTAHASSPDQKPYEAHCTTTFRRLAHEDWRVVQHQQTPPLVVSS
jgi:hypothetical protein